MKRSKVHWSELSEAAVSSDDEGAAEMDNREVFKSLQMHPTWGHFFITFGRDIEVFLTAGSLEVRSKFAEGGQAELVHAHVTWTNPEYNELDREDGTEWVLKVFRKGTLLRHLQSQWPVGYLQYWAENLEQEKLGKPRHSIYHFDVLYGTLLKDERLVLLMVKEEEDL